MEEISPLPQQSGSVEENNRRYRENGRIYLHGFLEGIYCVIQVVMYTSFIMIGSSLLIIHRNDRCDVPLYEWVIGNICFSAVMLSVIVYKQIKGINIENINEHKYVKITNKLLNIILLVIIIIGYILIWRAKDCSSYLYHIILSHLIIYTILLSLPLLIVLITCMCFPYIVLCLVHVSDEEGVSEIVMNRLPVYEYKNGIAIVEEHHNEIQILNQDQICCICMEDYVDLDKLRILDCKHNFHQHCCDQWLRINNSCPLCRQIACRMDPDV